MTSCLNMFWDSILILSFTSKAIFYSFFFVEDCDVVQSAESGISYSWKQLNLHQKRMFHHKHFSLWPRWYNCCSSLVLETSTYYLLSSWPWEGMPHSDQSIKQPDTYGHTSFLFMSPIFRQTFVYNFFFHVIGINSHNTRSISFNKGFFCPNKFYLSP